MSEEFDQPPRESLIAGLAGRQHGVVTAAQLRHIGLSQSNISQRSAVGRLHRLHYGVYAVGHRHLRIEGHWLAAVLACGAGAALSHRSAAALWDLRRSERRKIDVTVATRSGRSRPGIDIHRSTSMTPRDRTTRHGIPCTSVARTLLDLAEVVDRRALERACNQAEILDRLDLVAVRDVLDRAGRTALRGALSADARHTQTRSELEERFLAICVAGGLPRPHANAWIALREVAGDGVEVDFLWPAARLVAETDGHATHRTRQAFQRDRRRDQRLAVAGYRVLRFTWDQVTKSPDEVVATLGALASP